MTADDWNRRSISSLERSHGRDVGRGSFLISRVREKTDNPRLGETDETKGPIPTRSEGYLDGKPSNQTFADPPKLDSLDHHPGDGEDGSGVSVSSGSTTCLTTTNPSGSSSTAISRERRTICRMTHRRWYTRVWMKGKLLEVYRFFEGIFDGSKMLSIVKDLQKGSRSLEEGARNVNAALPKTSPKQTRDEVDRVFEANEVPETGEEPFVGDAVEELSVGKTLSWEAEMGDHLTSQGDNLLGVAAGQQQKLHLTRHVSM